MHDTVERDQRAPVIGPVDVGDDEACSWRGLDLCASERRLGSTLLTTSIGVDPADR